MARKRYKAEQTLEPLHLLPKSVIDDAQVEYGLDDPCLFGIETRHALPGVGILDVALLEALKAEQTMAELASRFDIQLLVMSPEPNQPKLF